MYKHFPRMGVAIFLLVAGVHAARLITGKDLGTIVPVWGSALLVPILFYVATQYLLEPKRARPRWGTKTPYYATVVIFCVAAFAHAYRVLVDSTIFSFFPAWASLLVIPVALALAAYNASLAVIHR